MVQFTELAICRLCHTDEKEVDFFLPPPLSLFSYRLFPFDVHTCASGDHAVVQYVMHSGMREHSHKQQLK